MSPISIGDCLALGDLALKLSKGLKEAGGASSEYQSLASDLQFFIENFKRIQCLAPKLGCLTPEQQKGLVDFVTESEKRINEIQIKISKFSETLGVGCRKKPVAGPARRVQWTLGYSEEANKLRTALNSETLGLLLCLEAHQVIATTDIGTRQACIIEKQKEVAQNVHSGLKDLETVVKSGFQAQESMFQQIASQRTAWPGYEPPDAAHIQDLKKAWIQRQRDVLALSNELAPHVSCGRPLADEAQHESWRNLIASARQYHDVMHHVLQVFRRHESFPQKKTEETKELGPQELLQSKERAVLLKECAIASMTKILLCMWQYMRECGPGILHAFAMIRALASVPRQPLVLAQNSIEFIDALDRIKLFDYENFKHWSVFEAALRVNFQNMPGQRKVEEGEFVFQDVRTSRNFTLLEWLSSVFPGSRIRMAVVMTELDNTPGLCPRPTCQAKVEAKHTDFVVCRACNLSFSASDLQVSPNTDESHNWRPNDSKQFLDKEERRRRELDEIRTFRRIFLLNEKEKREQQEAAKHPEKPTRSGDEVFYCCTCTTGPYLVALYPLCTACHHSRCYYCKID